MSETPSETLADAAASPAAIPETDVNSFSTLCTTMLLAVVGPEVFIVQPGFVQGMVQYLGMSEQAAGFAASAEMAGIAVITVLLIFFSHRVSWRKMLVGSLSVMAVANILCTQVTDPQTFTALRFLAGLGAGGVVSLSFTIVGLTSNPDRNFGYLIMWVLTYGALGLWVMPTAYEYAGMAGVLWFFAAFPAVLIPLMRFVPDGGTDVPMVEADAADLSRPMKGVALLAMLLYFLAQGVVWAYLFLIGMSGGLGGQDVANGLTLSQFFGIAGALLAAMLGARFGRARPLLIGIAGGAACLFFLYGGLSFLIFALAVCLYNFAWNVTQPYLLAAMASFDRKGKVVVYAVAMQMVGLAVGPGLAALVISGDGYGSVLTLGAVLFFLSLLCILPPVLTHERAATA